MVGTNSNCDFNLHCSIIHLKENVDLLDHCYA